MLCTLLLALPLAAAQAAFSDKAALQAALAEWCASPSSAAATHGDISTWDTSACTDMIALIFYAPCRDTFDANISSWNVASVTNMASMFRVLARPAQRASTSHSTSHTLFPPPRRMPAASTSPSTGMS